MALDRTCQKNFCCVLPPHTALPDGEVLCVTHLHSLSAHLQDRSTMPISMSGSPPKPISPNRQPVVVPGAPRWPGRDHDEFKREHETSKR